MKAVEDSVNFALTSGIIQKNFSDKLSCPATTKGNNLKLLSFENNLLIM